MDEYTHLRQGLAWTIDIITIGASIIFYYGFRKLTQRDYALYMLLALNVIDFTYALTSISAMAFDQDESTVGAFIGIDTSVFHFGLYWSTAIAVFIYKALRDNKPFNPKPFVIASAVCCLILTSVFPIV